MPRKKFSISGSGKVINEGADEQDPVYAPPTLILEYTAPEGNDIGDIQRFNTQDHTTLEETAKELQDPLRVLLAQAEACVSCVETLLAPERTWLENLSRIHWAGVAARYANHTGTALPNVHVVVSVLPTLVGAVDLYKTQLTMWRSAITQVCHAVHVDHLHTVNTEVRRIRKGLENIITSAEFTVKDQLSTLKETVAKIHKLIKAVGPVMGGTVVALVRPVPADTRPTHYE